MYARLCSRWRRRGREKGTKKEQGGKGKERPALPRSNAILGVSQSRDRSFRPLHVAGQTTRASRIASLRHWFTFASRRSVSPEKVPRLLSRPTPLTSPTARIRNTFTVITRSFICLFPLRFSIHRPFPFPAPIHRVLGDRCWNGSYSDESALRRIPCDE